jgi:hypothetical protein
MNGPMYKKGGKRTNWLQRHFTLFNGALCYYASKETKTPKGFVLTKDITEVRAEQAGKVGKKSGKGQYCLEVVTKVRTYYFAPDTAELRDQWIAAIKTWIGYSEEDVSTKELPQPGTSQRQSSASNAPAPAAAAAADAAASTTAAAATAAAADDKKPDDDAAAAGAGGDAAAAAAAAGGSTTSDSHKDDSAKEKDGADDESDSDDAKPDGAKAAGSSAGGDGGGVELWEAQFDYDAQEDNELSFKEGDIITVLDTFKGAGWWKCQLNGNIGLAPGNLYVVEKPRHLSLSLFAHSPSPFFVFISAA